ncbi:MAG: ATP-binding protein [Ruminococcus sp.]|nr:ATP-binding protein [Ruminococcus sp.]
MFDNLFRDMHAVPREGDYQGSDGLLYCGKCQTQRECLIELQDGRKICKPTPCQCERDEERKYKERREREAFQNRVNELRKQGVTDEAYTRQTFAADDNRNPKVTEKCRRYVDHWGEMKQNCYGMVLFGGVGGGKSFYACCIANALIDRGVKVLVTRLSDLVRHRIQQTSSQINLSEFDLIVLDDIGVESATQTAYNIADDIYRARIPLIVTTNLSLAQLKDKQQEIARQRIYDRIIERAVIDVFVDVRRSRIDIAREKSRLAHEILNH